MNKYFVHHIVKRFRILVSVYWLSPIGGGCLLSGEVYSHIDDDKHEVWALMGIS